MSAFAVRVEGLGKRYRIGTRGAAYQTLRETLSRWTEAPGRVLGRAGRADPGTDQEFWALRDVSFTLEHGDVLGVIGRNGAGKSTLLKILSRITEPTAGRALIDGRVGSLLEVGTGFHPELTGRENVYLNGAILGIPRTEISRRFDEIVAFAELERFLDTPVKRYSSGMYMRLAFSVAAHLEPDVLVVDEVLAVGDAEFQKKCLGKMGEVAGQGRTVLFVSHNMAAVSRLTTSALLLHGGRVAFFGPTDQAIATYLQMRARDESSQSDLALRNQSSGGIVLLSARLLEPSPEGFTVGPDEELVVELRFRLLEPKPNIACGIGIVAADSSPVATCFSDPVVAPGGQDGVGPGDYRTTVRVRHNLNLGLYSLTVGLHDPLSRSSLLYAPNVTIFEVVDRTGRSSSLARTGTGCVRLASQWTGPVGVEAHAEAV